MRNDEIIAMIRRLRVGDVIRINDWDKPMRVCGVSDHYVLAHAGIEYTILGKDPQEYSHNVPAGSPFCGADWWIFGYGDGYDFGNPQWVERYMRSLESGETEVSSRHREEIYFLALL